MNVQLTVTPAKGIFINNPWQAGASGKTVPVVAPAEGHAFATIAAGNAADIEKVRTRPREGLRRAARRLAAAHHHHQARLIP